MVVELWVGRAWVKRVRRGGVVAACEVVRPRASFPERLIGKGGGDRGRRRGLLAFGDRARFAAEPRRLRRLTRALRADTATRHAWAETWGAT